jgi:acyl-CoA synthetase (AMP-forming)/AMP-acid ligase II
VTVPHTFIVTTGAISQSGAFPEFVDVDEQTYNMDPAKLAVYLEKQCSVDDNERSQAAADVAQSPPSFRSTCMSRWLIRMPFWSSPRGGEEVVAFVRLSPSSTTSEGELAQHLAPHKRPTQILLVPSMPLTSTGKVVKGRARKDDPIRPDPLKTLLVKP